MDAVARVKELSERAKKSGRVPRAAPVQLPLWAPRKRGLPNPLARCALFTASGKTEPRIDFKRSVIASLEGYEIAYTGEELRQDDQDVFLQLVHVARQEDLGTQLQVTVHSILVALGWGRAKDAYDRLHKSVARLREGTVWVTFSAGGGAAESDDGKAPTSKGFTGNLIKALDWEGDKWMLSLDQRMIALFGSDGYTAINWEERLSLGPLAKWLHSFYFTHREPLPYTVRKLYELCGSKAKQLKHFRASLKKALDELVAVGFLVEWSLDAKSDKISVKRRHTPVLTAA
ncbi:TrfA family protein [Burkholderia cenocepacia]|nr:plasmid replication initiator TrfA [Burkholderia cenocepacia]MCO8402771.1 TrfA family protein [Burkholderia cenocepacia]MCO8415107.1 TrfA family protein [Burkholderia cenocepacia]MCO8423094.1 TrfA family protein [Burkholderia cenocepacia]MCO8474757.1 TrfA family protein [Burkholderia cenocepacia]MCO8482063.1 TrfA family protein [Burkholderia cenocepacia]